MLVALGTLLSSFWILSVTSWIQTPAGHEIVDGRFFPTSMLAVIFTPSFPYRLSHTLSAFLITTAFVILTVDASYLVVPAKSREVACALGCGVGNRASEGGSPDGALLAAGTTRRCARSIVRGRVQPALVDAGDGPAGGEGCFLRMLWRDLVAFLNGSQPAFVDSMPPSRFVAG